MGPSVAPALTPNTPQVWEWNTSFSPTCLGQKMPDGAGFFLGQTQSRLSTLIPNVLL